MYRHIYSDIHYTYKNLPFFCIYLLVFKQLHVPAVEMVLDPPTQLSTPSWGAEPSSESAASLMLDLLHGTVFHTISIISVTLVFSRTA